MKADEGTRKPRLGPNPEREVPVLFPETEVEVTPEQIAFYRRAGRFAFAIDRQSLHKEAVRKGATGMVRRVDSIVHEAAYLDLYLPTPTYLPDVPEGTLPYDFDEDFWFCDGTTQRATGFAMSQNARPRLWRAFLLAQALSKHGCAPKAFVIGEATRLFRDEGWLATFIRALWKLKIKVVVSGFGEVTKDTLPGLVAYINALSGWLGKVRQSSWEIKKRNGVIAHKKPPMMLEFSPDGAEVYANATNWPIVGEMLEKLADGELASSLKASTWLKEVHGIERGYGWVCDLLHSSIPDGIYDRAFSRECTPRMLKQKGGLFYDLDITPTGNRRYVDQKVPGIPKPIQHIHGTEPFAPEIVQAARRRVLGRRGRPGKNTPAGEFRVPFRILRCAHCGRGIHEVKDDGSYWHLRCNIGFVLMKRLKLPYREAILHPECQHPTYRKGRAAEAIWKVVWKALKENPVLPVEPEQDAQSELRRAEADLAAAQATYDKFQREVLAGTYGDEDDDIDRTWIRKKREELKKDLRAAQQEAETFAGRLFTASCYREAWNEVHEAFAEVEEWELTPEKRRNIIEQLVDRVDLDLGTGQFVVNGVLDVPFLRQLAGSLENVSNSTDGCSMG